ncbi:class I SAM-dependent methyltransferase [Crocinitomicaceae bacterium]|nr:class I SAM-dependent methyltransferase [Crocinitomicaceae bacterium]MDB3906795.1 class I SAM-dependent methyltransferase [Crocinitomicaceae bacterium]MDC0257864.1 class I SAM-dependent methyltransferase [Crocinitomicaceae bacterium]
MADKYYHTEESVAEYIRLSKDVNSQQLIDKLNPFLPPSSLLLELGTGPGTDWTILSKNYQVTGSDLSKVFLERLQKLHPQETFLCMDAVTLEVDTNFDGIYSNKVLHHLKDDELSTSVQRQSEILHPNGIVCHSFWKGEDSEEFKGMFVNYHTMEAVKNFFEAHFETLHISLYQEFDPEDSIVYIGKKRNN